MVNSDANDEMSESVGWERRSSRALIAAAVLAVVALLTALVGESWDVWARTPIAIRFITGFLVFGVSPGLMVCGWFFSATRARVSLADFAVSVLTSSFSCNLAFNVLLFARHSTMSRLSHAYVIAQLVGYALWGAWGIWQRVSGSTAPVASGPRASSTSTEPSSPWLSWAGWTLLGLTFAIVVYIAYTKGSPITNSEEMVVLRKLVENPGVRYDNVSYRDGDPSTYLFVPFQILIAGTSVIGKMDVSLVYSMFFSVSTGLSIFVIGMLLYVISGKAAVAGVGGVWMLVIALFDPDSVIYGSGIITAFPNRYGFAGGVLLPLILLLFWSVLREPQFRLWRWALLVYVAVEATFVHARETLLSLGAMAAVFALLAVRPQRNRLSLLRITAVVIMAGLVLVGYKRVNLALSPDLDAYVGALTEASRTALLQMMANNTPIDLLTVSAPISMVVTVNSGEPIRLGLVTYRSMFVDTWQFGFLGRLYLPVVLLILPLFALTARSVAELSIATVLAALGLITGSGLLNLLLSSIVGSPEILIVYNIVALFSVLVICLAAWNLASTVCKPFAYGGQLRLWKTPTRTGGGGRLLASAPAVTTAMLISAGLVGAGYLGVERMIQARTELYSIWSDRFGFILLFVTVAAIVFKIRSQDLPLFAPVSRVHPATVVVSTTFLVLLLLPAIVRSTIWHVDPLRPPYPSSGFTGDFVGDYPMLVAPESKKLDPTPYPLDVIRYLREQVPPNQTIIASDSLALLERVPHFVPFLSNKGEVAPHFIVNSEFLRDYSRSGPKHAMAPFVENEDTIELFHKMLARFRVDYLVVDPQERDAFVAALGSSPRLRKTIVEKFSADGYVIYATVPDAAGAR